MTAGHLDWQGYATWRGPLITAAVQTVTSVAPFTVDSIVTNFGSVFIGASLNSGTGATITASWYTDSTKTTRIAQKQWVLNPTNFVNQNVPSLGNFLEVVVSTGQAGNQVVFLSIVPNNVATPKVTSVRGCAQTGGIQSSILNAATPSFILPEIVDGDGLLSVSCAVTNTSLGLFVDRQIEGGAIDLHLAETTGVIGEQQLRFKAGGQPVCFTVHNFTGATVVIDWALQVQPN